MAITGRSFTSVFPMDSEWELDEEGKVKLDEDTGLPIADRAYNSSDIRRVIAAYVTDGVVPDAGDELMVTVEAGSVYIGTGLAFESGLLVDLTEKTRVADLSDIPTGSYLFAILQARFDQPNRDGYPTARVVQSTSVELSRNESVWELALARVDWRGTVTDLRMDNAYCGPVSAVVPVDTDSFMASLQTAVSQFNLNVGTVTTLPSGSTPEVTVRKPVEAGGEVFIDFGIPRGATGEPGRDGESAPTCYISPDGEEPPRAYGNVWLVDERGEGGHVITDVRCYETDRVYPSRTLFPSKTLFPGGTGQWVPHKLDPSIIAAE